MNEALQLPASSHVEHNTLTEPDRGTPHNTGMVLAMLFNIGSKIGLKRAHTARCCQQYLLYECAVLLRCPLLLLLLSRL